MPSCPTPRAAWNPSTVSTFFPNTLRPEPNSADVPNMMVASTGRGMCKLAVLKGLAVLIALGLFGGRPALAQKARTGLDAPATRASLPNTTPDVTPSRGIGPFDAKQAQEGRDGAEVLCAQSRYGEAEKLYLKLLDEREHALALTHPY